MYAYEIVSFVPWIGQELMIGFAFLQLSTRRPVTLALSTIKSLFVHHILFFFAVIADERTNQNLDVIEMVNSLRSNLTFYLFIWTLINCIVSTKVAVYVLEFSKEVFNEKFQIFYY